MTTDLDVLDDKALRKTWLKRKFGSYQYHEEMLAIHAQWVALIYKAPERTRAAPRTW